MKDVKATEIIINTIKNIECVIRRNNHKRKKIKYLSSLYNHKPQIKRETVVN